MIYIERTDVDTLAGYDIGIGMRFVVISLYRMCHQNSTKSGIFVNVFHENTFFIVKNYA